MEGKTGQKKLTNSQQFIKLLEEMKKNPEFARGFPKFGKSKEDVNEFWKNLTVMLNALGPPIKESLEWRRVWNDYKRNLKQKIAKNNNEIRATGGGQNAQQHLTPMEQEVDALIHLTKSGAPNGTSFPRKEPGRETELGVTFNIEPSTSLDNLDNNAEIHQNQVENITDIQINVEPPNINSNTRNPKPSSISKSTDRQRIQLLQTQTTKQNEIVEILHKIEANTYKMQYYLKKSYELKAKKLKLYEEQLNRQNRKDLQAHKIVYEKLKLKKRLVIIEECKLGIKHASSSSENED